jgi:hypothetical protein
MKGKSAISSLYGIYDLSNPHFRDTEVITSENKAIKGQFVKFKVAQSGNRYISYPSEKYCFLPEKHKEEFWNIYQSDNGVFPEMPEYIKEFGLNDIKKIIILPVVLI